ncbi:hypothetical protein ASPZODRAFT_2112204 [Penicilliopsis zonata CBS 506.65]|uniref:Uncharacterized protein n=1 Tax=Penicilliopsis zonata CBS 506.65 TaxID=1073090 RepID=A0A1L9SAR4_9EURO|nr:hypothetical protein ASPZODRAFT_2112204 [Penicilliopsis zonata CBS 506.65]OJJ44231.1 hypothetical protein ASPZODRAFT_2112204 [Penicilliopsis zonata CBS 506.65]
MQDGGVKTKQEDVELKNEDSILESNATTTVTLVKRGLSCQVSVPLRDFGPDQQFPQHLKDMLEEWHEIYPLHVPACSFRSRGLGWKSFKIFDRNGVELELSQWLIKKPLPYRVLVLHYPDSPEELVACANNSPTITYLLPWKGLNRGYDSSRVAARVFNRNMAHITFNDQVFDRYHEGLLPRRYAQYSRASVPRAKRTISFRTTASADNPFASPHLPQLPGAWEDGGYPLTNFHPNVMFKLIDKNTDISRCVPFDECHSVQELFTKARAFFQSLNEGARVKALSCCFSKSRRYIWENEGEFELMLNDAKMTAQSDEETVTVEVYNITPIFTRTATV